jgi:serine/alanine adding enzyme
MNVALETRTAIEVRPVEPGAEWDAFVAASPESTFCHRAGWAGVLARTLGARTHCLEARDGAGTLQGVLPLYRVRSALLGDYLVSVPFLNYGGALGSEEARSALAEAAVALGRELRVDAVELRARNREESTLQSLDRKVTVELSLPATEAELWSALPSKLRSQVRRPMKAGMTARHGPQELDAFHDVFARNMRDLGTPVLPRRFFADAASTFGGDVVITTIRHEGRAVAAGFGFLHHGEFEITWASSLREYNPMSPNMLLYWELMKHAIERGAHTFNFGRCSPGGGTHRFKLQWGGSDVPLGWSVWSRNGGDGTPKPDKPIFRIATSLWQRMPLWAANTIGPLVSRSIP